MGETRTRVLILYLATMLGVGAIAIPVFRALLFGNVDARVREDLAEEVEDLQESYDDWAATAGPGADVGEFVDEYIRNHLPEDDNFHLFWIDGDFYRANPATIPEAIAPDSEMASDWGGLIAEQAAAGSSEMTNNERPTNDPAVGNIVYSMMPLMLNQQQRGTFIVTHLTAGERAEALEGVYIFAQVAAGVVLTSFLLAWLGSRHLFAPVRSLTMAARSISESNLSERLPVRGKGELAQLSATFNAMMNRLETAFESQRNFINDASHELRTPITIIQGHLELMEDDPAEQQEALELVMDELGRMTRFINELLLLAKSERPDFLKLETIDVAALTDDIQRKAVGLASRNWQFDTCATGTVVGDRGRIAGAWLNLVNNAVQHTQDTDTIEIGSAINGSQARFWVRDSGPGISPQDQARIFDRFARVSNAYRSSEGAGLGLAIVKAIAETHHGHVELTSQQGMGSTFTLVLPRVQPRRTV
ncbi:MAG: HAMP domain-containing sensor histidine kinase [Cyanobacteria bacterium P01_A01_bin.135]